jgi:hypothetical protein
MTSAAVSGVTAVRNPAGVERVGKGMRRLLLLAVLVACVASPAATATATAAPLSTTVVALSRPTPVREYAGWLLYSRWDGKAYHLAVWHDGAARDLAVPAQSRPFDADAGPDSAGHPSAAYSACDGKTCDLYVISFAPGAQPRPVGNANTTDRDELAPTIWHGRIAFARRASKDEVVPYTKLLRAPRSTPSARLAGLPSTRCGAVDPPDCRPIKAVGDPALELWGRWVAQSWTYQPDGFPGFRQNEIRLTTTDRSDTRQLAYMTGGEGGQTYLGPSIASGRVAFFKACQGDPGGCSPTVSGAFRYRISANTYDLAGAQEAWEGWAYDGAADVHVPSAFDCSGGDPGAPPSEPCGIIRRTGLTFTPIAAGHVR